MCDTCGCGIPGEKALIRVPGENEDKTAANHHEHEHEHEHSYPHYHSHDHEHNHEHNHEHDHSHENVHSHEHDHISHEKRTINLETDILYANNLMAERNRGIFEAKDLTVVNLMSSPGSGKTTLLEKTMNELKDKISFAVIEGDQQTMNDSERINLTGVPVVQVNTGSGCHLDAEMINRAAKKLNPENGSVIMIENVGNLVCPALFDLGESARVVIMSVTEGEDKPVKYPNMFRNASLCLLNKCDLLPWLDYDISKAIEYLHQVNPHLRFIKLSAKTGEGMADWYKWIGSTLSKKT